MFYFGIQAGFNKSYTCNKKNSIELYMAKNEGESCVISLLSQSCISGASFDVIGGDASITVETEREHFISCDGKLYPDPLVPVKTFDINKDELCNILIRFTSATDTPAGKHTFTLRLKDSNGGTLKEFFIAVNVWDFALSTEHRVCAFMNIIREYVEAYHKPASEDELNDLYKKYYDLLLKFRVNAFTLPYDLLDDRADEYLSDPRVLAFLMDVLTESDETVSKQYEKLKTNEKWLKKGIIYPVDEPTCTEHLDKIITLHEHYGKLCPNMRKTSAFYRDIEYKDTDLVNVLIDNCELMLPKLTCFNDDFVYFDKELNLLERFGSFKPRMDKARDNGAEIWQYVCWEPGKPYVNMYVDETGLDHRIIFWQQHLTGATGFLYWAVNWWKFIDDPWQDMATVPDLSEHVFGDGSLVYNGNKVGIDGPCASVRLEAVRDGIEDCEMLLMADEVLGRDTVLEYVKIVTRDLVNYTDSPELFTEVRMLIGNAIEAALKKK